MPQQTSIYQLPYPEPTDIPDVPEDMRRLAEAVEIAIDSSIPVGVIMAWGGTVAPSGWHLCNGTPHGSPELQHIIGSPNAPDLRDRFIVGAGIVLRAGRHGRRQHGPPDSCDLRHRNPRPPRVGHRQCPRPPAPRAADWHWHGPHTPTTRTGTPTSTAGRSRAAGTSTRSS